jgi:hypothetical protein
VKQVAIRAFLHAGFLLGLLPNPDDGGGIFIRNDGWLSTDYTALYPRRHNSLTIYVAILLCVKRNFTFQIVQNFICFADCIYFRMDTQYVNYLLYWHVLSDYRRVLDWQLDLLDHNLLHNSVTVYYTLQLTTIESLPFLWRPRLQLLQPTLMASLAITSHDWLGTVLNYIARERTTKKAPSPIPLLLYDVITGTNHKENASTVAWLSIVLCLFVAIATVVNTYHIAYSMHVTVCLGLSASVRYSHSLLAALLTLHIGHCLQFVYFVLPVWCIGVWSYHMHPY